MQFQTGYFYHIYNRGVDKREVFIDKNDYLRFLISLREFNTSRQIESLRRLKQLRRESAPKALSNRRFDSALGATTSEVLVEIVCYCLISNHYHLLLRKAVDGGISKFMQKVSQGYTAYFNLKHNRSGSLFQGPFKAVPVKTDGRFWEVSFYVNGNYEIHGLGRARDWVWSSCQDYLGIREGDLCRKEAVLKDFSGLAEYEKLMFNYINDKKAWKQEIKLYE